MRSSSLTWMLLCSFASAAGASADATESSAGLTIAAETRDTPHVHAAPVVLAPGYFDLTFTAPPPGSYSLPSLGAAADAPVLLESGEPVHLHTLYEGRIVLLSFIYTSCSDVNGCPLATHVLAKVQERLAMAEDLTGRVRLLSLSFDPEHDTPAVMRDYGARFQAAGADWRFLTSLSSDALAPVLADYDQSVIREIDEQGRALGTLSHILRVYLIDLRKEIRNIYSVSFLHADTLLNDIRTLLAPVRSPCLESAETACTMRSR